MAQNSMIELAYSKAYPNEIYLPGLATALFVMASHISERFFFDHHLTTTLTALKA